MAEAGEVAEGGVERHAEGHLGVERGCDNGERASLAAARHAYVLPVPLGQRAEKVDAARAPRVDAAVVERVFVLDAPPLVVVGHAACRGVEVVAQFGVAATVYADVEIYVSLLTVVGGEVYLLCPCPGRAEEHGVLALGLGLGEVAVHIAPVGAYGEPDEERLHAVGGAAWQRRDDGVELGGGSLLERFLPEAVEVARHGGEGLYPFGAESHLHEVFILLAVDGEAQAAGPEARFAARTHWYYGLAAGEGHGVFGGGQEHLVAHAVMHHHAVEGQAALVGLDGQRRLLACLIVAVGVAGREQVLHVLPARL